MASIGEQDQLGLAFRFEVVVDGFDLGSWGSCHGLGVSFKHEQVRELGQHAGTAYVPGRAEYTAVTLQRAMRSGDWDTTKRWLTEVSADSWLTSKPTTYPATITMKDAKLETVATWTLRNAMPSAWKGPQFDATGKTVAIETLELVHEGFLDD